MRSSKTLTPLLLVAIIFLTNVTASAALSACIDEHNRFVLNGKPFFPLGLYVVQSLTDTNELDEIANSPFDTLMNYNVNSGTDAQITQYLNELESRKLKLIFSLKEYVGHGHQDIDTISHKVKTFGSHPSIISWYLNDELSPKHLLELEVRYEKVRELDANHPVWSVHWNRNWLVKEGHTTDIVGVDPYPIDNNPITLVSQMADAARKVGKPLWLVPQVFSWQDYPADFRAVTGRPPTRDEMRAMTYLAVNHGAKGLIYYSYFNIRDDKDYGTRWQQIKEIGEEIDTLRLVFLSSFPTNDGDIECTDTNIDFQLMREGDTYYLFAVNTKKIAISDTLFRVNLIKAPSTIDTMFEGDRRIPVSNGGFRDHFTPYEVHVYRWR